MKTQTVSATVLIKNQRIVCKGKRKRGSARWSKWDETNNMKAQLNVVSHEMCSESKKRWRFSLAQMIVILGSSEWLPITFNDSHTIADDSLWGLEWPLEQISTDNVQARRVENEDPPSTWELSIFQKAVPLKVKRIEVNRVHIPDWDDGEFVHDDGEESLGLFKLKFSLFLFWR